MQLQHLLQHFFVLRIISSDRTTSTCRCLYGQLSWPNENEFATLAAQLSQPLLHPIPPASACYMPSAPYSNCSGVIANYMNGNWRSGQPGAMQNTNFETFIFHNNTLSACYLNTTLGNSCGQGSVPPIGVDARSGSDIQAAVNFAKHYNLKLVVKNTGHDYLGRSTARGGFLIWTHNMKEILYNPNFVPEGAPAIAENTFNAVTLGAGVQWREAYDFVQQQGRFIVGGLSAGASVGATAGWIMGGGHSAFSSKFGLGVDNVLQFTIVLANGSLVTTNSFQYPDLFWALRGGGGAGLAAPNISWADANGIFLPFVQYVEEVTGGLVQVMTVPFNSFYELYLALFASVDGQVGSPVEIASRLLSRSLAETDPAKAAKIMLSLDSGVGMNSVAGGAVSRVDPDSTGLNPSWRKTLSEVYIVASWPEGSTADFISQQIDRLKQSTLIDSGSYLNEGSLYELDFKKSYFGDHYDKLESIKNKYDPTSLFVVASGVGSDKWDGGLVCKVEH